MNNENNTHTKLPRRCTRWRAGFRHNYCSGRRPVALVDKGIARAGARVLRQGKEAGFVTSGTMVPYWQSAGAGIASVQTVEKGMRAIGLASLKLPALSAPFDRACDSLSAHDVSPDAPLQPLDECCCQPSPVFL